jgi:hypothetical protein
VHDPPLIGEHRLERHRLAARAHAVRDATRDLAELLLAAVTIAFDVQRHVDGAADPSRRYRGRDLLQGDKVFAAATDQRAQIRT